MIATEAPPAGFSDTDYPSAFITTDAAALQSQRAYLGRFKLDILLVLLATAVGTAGSIAGHRQYHILSWSVPDVHLVFVAAAIIFLVFTTLLQYDSAIQHRDKSWYDSRAGAEAIRSLTWRFMTRATPYDTDDKTARQQFLDDLTATLHQFSNLKQAYVPSAVDAGAISPAMKAVRALSLPLRRDFYVENRVRHQHRYYARKANQNSKLAARWSSFTLAARGIALAAAVAAIVLPLSLISFMGAVAVAVTSWGQIGRYDELSSNYAATALALDTLLPCFDDCVDEAGFTNLVTRVETVLLAENVKWANKPS